MIPACSIVSGWVRRRESGSTVNGGFIACAESPSLAGRFRLYARIRRKDGPSKGPAGRHPGLCHHLSQGDPDVDYR